MRGRQREDVPADRDALTALYQQHGSWSAVARALHIPRPTLQKRLDKVHLTSDPSLDRTSAQRRLPREHAWLLDREELRRQLQAHGTIAALALSIGAGSDTVRRYVASHSLTPDEWVPTPDDYGVPRYDQELVLEGDWAITGDYHLPYVDADMIALLCRMGRAWGIENLLIAGDFLDLDQFAQHDPLAPTVDWSTTKALASRILGLLAEAFPQIIWTLGNHEMRITRLTKGAWGIPELVATLGVHGVRGVVAPTVAINTPQGMWDVVHPASYSRIPTRVGAELAAIYHRHQIGFHGHLTGRRKDISGRFHVIDAGMMADSGRIAYRNLRRTTHPAWGQGFVLLRKGYAYPIAPDMDVDFWVRAGAQG